MNPAPTRAALVIVCPACSTDIPARHAPLVKTTCTSCGSRIEVNMEREDQ